MSKITLQGALIFAAGVFITAALWWEAERLLNRHIGPRVDGYGL